MEIVVYVSCGGMSHVPTYNMSHRRCIIMK